MKIGIGKYKTTVSTFISWTMKLLLFSFFCIEFYTGNYTVAIAALAALFISLLPSSIERNYSINLPKLVDFSITFVLLLHILGLFYNFYHDDAWWWWDIMTHFLGTAVIAFLSFYIVFTLDYLEKIKLNLIFIVIATMTTALAIGALWEIAEFYTDKFFGTNTVLGIVDTIHDLIFDLLGATAVSIIGVIYVNYIRKKKHGIK